MYYAQDEDKQLVHISKINKNIQYRCPICKQKVKVRKAINKKTHFAHFKNQQHSQLGESEIHNAGKKLLAKWSEELGYQVVTEYQIKSIAQRADLYLQKKNHKIILEYQCSPLTTDKLIQRSRGYKRLKFNFFWIVGERYRLKKQITQSQAKFFHYRSNLGFYLIYLNVEFQRLELFYQILKADFLTPIYRIKYFYSLADLINFIKTTPFCSASYPKLNANNQQYQLRNLQRLRLKPTKKFFKIQRLCYERGLNFDELVSYCLVDHYEYPIYQNCGFYFRVGCFFNLSELQQYYQIPFVNLSNVIR